MKAFALLIALFLTGCTNAPSYPVDSTSGSTSPHLQSNPKTDSAGTSTSAAAGSPIRISSSSPESALNYTPCRFIASHIDNNGNYVTSTYECHRNSIYATNSLNSCTWVAPYTQPDGTAVAGYNRCKYNIRPTSYIPSASSSESSSCTSYCGSINVRGYYRKNGTYVRPHTRRRSR